MISSACGSVGTARPDVGCATLVQQALGKNFVTKFGTKQGILGLGRVLPLGLGALIGVGGNTVVGYMSVRAARVAFGPLAATHGTRPSTSG